jgi:hypothetical protein
MLSRLVRITDPTWRLLRVLQYNVAVYDRVIGNHRSAVAALQLIGHVAGVGVIAALASIAVHIWRHAHVRLAHVGYIELPERISRDHHVFALLHLPYHSGVHPGVGKAKHVAARDSPRHILLHNVSLAASAVGRH